MTCGLKRKLWPDDIGHSKGLGFYLKLSRNSLEGLKEKVPWNMSVFKKKILKMGKE